VFRRERSGEKILWSGVKLVQCRRRGAEIGFDGGATPLRGIKKPQGNTALLQVEFIRGSHPYAQTKRNERESRGGWIEAEWGGGTEKKMRVVCTLAKGKKSVAKRADRPI